MVYSRLIILPTVARVRITASLTFVQKNICGQLKLLAVVQKMLTLFEAQNAPMRSETTLTDTKLCLKIARKIGSLYALNE